VLALGSYRRHSTKEPVVKRHTTIALIALLLLVVALAGWMVDGVRWLAAGPRRQRLAPSV
jgi:hypothetical protein